MDEEYIIGRRDITFEDGEEIWLTNDSRELIDHLGEEVADQVMQELKRYCQKYNCRTDIPKGKWAKDFQSNGLMQHPPDEYEEQLIDFKNHLDRTSDDLQDCLQTTGYDEAKHDIIIKLNGKELVVPMNADSYTSLLKFIQDERINNS